MHRLWLKSIVGCWIATIACTSPAQDSSRQENKTNAATEQLLTVPIGGYVVGGHAGPILKNPYEGDKQAIAQGRSLFDAMNCSGCHAPLGGGGMGPPLSDDDWIYGGEPGNIYLSVLQGRPNGMPAFQNLGSEVIWKLVSYIRTLNQHAR